MKALATNRRPASNKLPKEDKSIDGKEHFILNSFFAATIGITVGLLLLMTGLILSAVSYLNRSNFHGWEVILLVASFVCLAFGAQSLDKAYDANKTGKFQSFRKRG